MNGHEVDFTPATRADVDANGFFVHCPDWPLELRAERKAAVCAALGVKVSPSAACTLSRVAGRKIGGSLPGMPTYYPEEHAAVPAVEWFDHTVMLHRPRTPGVQPVPRYILATMPYGLRPAMVDALAAQVAPYGLQVGVFPGATWWVSATTLVLVAQPGMLPAVWDVAA